MPMVIAQMMVTLDGYAAGPDGALDWVHTEDPELDDYLADVLTSVGAQVFGRTAYEGVAEYWTGDEAAFESSGDARLAPLVNGVPKIVVTSRPDRPLAWQPATAIGGDLADDVRRLKSEPGDPVIVFAGATTLNSFLRLGAVDELRLLVFPVFAGGGQRLFDLADTGPVELIDVRAFPASGVVLQRYRL
ncbi:dihydrofolate reductase family protein [Nocardia puris]|uniref:Dihydrofolate reductase n=2 Tax=Nocardia puris TaxID=208602 RepID=A0A366DWL0_9NOCA|nr:dihydrofolate reductase family protein [Nocardia puris]MBF6366355.1 dihydrofolate reductase family protein [Nocardia puris]MBF6458306.1 dihydrofolate reductase family protein [Nocardia puris]RBO94480.1 dihydrofolate reductase [Nocardia puris]